MNYFLFTTRYVAIFLLWMLSATQLVGCATATENTCQNSPMLLTDLTKPAQQRHASLPDGTPCYHEAYSYGN